MSGMPHASDPATIPVVLRAVRNAAPPGKVGPQFLEANGLTDGHGAHLGLLRAIGFIDASGTPTPRWTAYREPTSADRVLGEALRVGYAPLFETYPDAPRQDDSRLAAVVRSHTRYAAPHVTRTIASFRILCRSAEFGLTDTSLDVATLPATSVPLGLRERVEGLQAFTAGMQEALTCIGHDLYRPAYVSMWSGFVALALNALSADNFSALHGVRPGWTDVSLEDVATRTSGPVLLETLGKVGLCTLDERESLDRLMRRRDDCVNPTTFAPTREEAMAYVNEVSQLAESLTAASRRG